MPFPTCPVPSCGGRSFESETTTVSGYNYKVNLFKCMKCGAVVGVMPYYDAGELGHLNQKAIAELRDKLDQLAGRLSG